VACSSTPAAAVARQPVRSGWRRAAGSESAPVSLTYATFVLEQQRESAAVGPDTARDVSGTMKRFSRLSVSMSQTLR